MDSTPHHFNEDQILRETSGLQVCMKPPASSTRERNIMDELDKSKVFVKLIILVIHKGKKVLDQSPPNIYDDPYY